MHSLSEDLRSLLQATFPREDAPLLYSEMDRMWTTKPLDGLTIAHNCPVTLSTLVKIAVLLDGGAKMVSVVLPDFVRSNTEAVEWLRKGFPSDRVEVLSNPAAATRRTFDIILDCCGEVARVAAPPRLGASELTQTGELVFRNEIHPSYPVISVDSSKTKRLEDAFGSADGFMRSMDVYLPEQRNTFSNRRVILFGFGKVGVGIAHRLLEFTNDIWIIDLSVDALTRAKDLGFEHALHISTQQEEIKEAIANPATLCIVTCTGTKNLLSDFFPDTKFTSVPYLSNIGAIDEYGPMYSEEDVLYAKQPCNFILEKPTTIQYLDPAFFAQNECVELLLAGRMSAGVHSLPSDLDESIIVRWREAHRSLMDDATFERLLSAVTKR